MELNDNRAGYKKTKLGWIPIEWSIIRLGDFFQFKNGLNKGKEFFGKGTPIVNYMDVFKNNALKSNQIFGRVEVTKNELINCNVNKGDVLFTRTSETQNEIGYASVILDDLTDTVFSGFLLRGRPNDDVFINGYKKYCFSTYLARKEIRRKSSFTTRALTNGKLLSDVLILKPPLSEQKKIAEILSTWDHAIERTEKLIEEKEKLKKGLMQQLLTGKVRFKEFVKKEGFKDTKIGMVPNDWGIVKIKYISNSYSGGTPSRKNSEFFHGNIPWIKSGELNNRVICKTEEHITLEAIESCSTKYVEPGTLLLALYGATAGISGFTNIEATINQAILAIKTKENIYKYHLYYWLFLNKNRILARYTQGGQPNLNAEIIKNLTIPLPNLPEQIKVSDLLKELDNTIHEIKIQKKRLEGQKKGLMQQLLTGKIRVKIEET